MNKFIINTKTRRYPMLPYQVVQELGGGVTLPEVNVINLWWTLVVGSATVTIVVFRRTAVHSGNSRIMLRIAV
jgi:hypothetical protein